METKTNGLVQIYTGDGKGKTTAALGLAARACGWGRRVIIYQFLKPASIKTGERQLDWPAEFVNVDINWDMHKSLDEPETLRTVKQEISTACRKIADDLSAKRYDILIMDEIIFCLSKNLADIADIKNIIACNAGYAEIILTGRGADKKIIALADLVTEMKLVKHPYANGITARQAIEY